MQQAQSESAGWFSFDGRIGRASFLGRTIAAGILPGFVVVIALAVGAFGVFMWLAFVATAIASLVISLGSYINRIRDMEANPILVVLLFLPLVNTGLWIACVFVPSQRDGR